MSNKILWRIMNVAHKRVPAKKKLIVGIGLIAIAGIGYFIWKENKKKSSSFTGPRFGVPIILRK